MTFPPILFIFLLLILCGGCVSLATVKSAESSKEGEINLGMALTGRFNLEGEARQTIYSMEPYAIFGVTDEIDIEAKYHWGPIFGAKFTHLQNVEKSYASEVAVGFVGQRGLVERPANIDLYATGLFSYRFQHVHIFTFGPKMIFRERAGDTNQWFLGAFVNARIKVNPTVHITPEFSLINQDPILRLTRDKAPASLVFSFGFNHQF